MLLPNLPPPEEGIKHRQTSTRAFVGQRELGSGVLYIAESRVSWAKEGEDSGLSLEYPHIAIHAVSRDLSNFCHPCLYLMIDVKLEEPENAMNGGNSSDSEEEEDEDAAMTEVRFVPSDPSSLDHMYKALNECQVLHPDPEDQPSDDEIGEEEEDEGEYEISENGEDVHGVYEDAMEGDLEDGPLVGGMAEGRTARNGIDDDDAMETGQFDDAD